MKKRNPMGWGYIEEAATQDERRLLKNTLGGMLGGRLEYRAPPAPADVDLPAHGVSVPERLQPWVSTQHDERLLHAVGRSFKDLASLRDGRLAVAPAAVARPTDKESLARVLDWAGLRPLAVIPFGGGSSVVGGVTPEALADGREWLCIDLQGMNRVHEIETTDLVVEAEAGILGPDLDQALRPHGLTVRHYPQSYYHSSLGGWVATRGAGHYSTLHAKIEDRVEALRVMLPDGSLAETRPLPASSIGPDPNRLWCGSEGTLGIITAVRLRIHRRPSQRATAGVRFADFESSLEAARAIVQAGLWPAQMRILDPMEHMLSAARSGREASGAFMILGFESAHLGVDPLLAHALELAREHGGEVESGLRSKQGVEDWRQAFFRQPYMRDVLLDYAVIADTFETAVPWHKLPGFYHSVLGATRNAVNEVCGSGGVTCRVTHAYPDGVCLYFSFYGTGHHDALSEQWREIKAAASGTVLAGGGTMSHHHAMGRDHSQWAREELPTAFRAAIRGTKRELDPGNMLNPGLWFET